MTPAERRLFDAFQRQVAGQRPEVARALLASFKQVRSVFTDAQLERIVSRQVGVDEFIARVFAQPRMDSMFAQAKQSVRDAIEQGAAYYTRALPFVAGGGSIAFDVLNPKFIDAIKKLDSEVFKAMQSDIKTTVRSVIERGLTDSWTTAKMAKELRGTVGLAPNQWESVMNYRNKLESGLLGATKQNQLRDRRFDRLLKRGTVLTPAKIDMMVTAYARRMESFALDTIAQTATRDAMRLGNFFARMDAIDKGILPAESQMKRWVGVMDDREREEHVAMEGEEVPIDQPFSNGEMICGESTYNCRCICVYFEAVPDGPSLINVEADPNNPTP